jgi:hypothetical protein
MPPGDEDAYAMLPTASTCKRRCYAALGVCLKDNERYECDRSTPTTHTSSFLWVPTQRRGIPMGTLLFTVEYEETEEKFEFSSTFEPRTNQYKPHESNPRYCSISLEAIGYSLSHTKNHHEATTTTTTTVRAIEIV